MTRYERNLNFLFVKTHSKNSSFTSLGVGEVNLLTTTIKTNETAAPKIAGHMPPIQLEKD